MKRYWIVELICFLFIFLFVHTGVSKYLNFADFKAVIGQSPIVTKFALPIALVVPFFEIVISIFLVIPRFRLSALLATFFLMVLFTIYIIMLVTISETIPCSCGGVIQEMSWQQHIVFNVIFTGFAVVATLLESKHRRIKGNNTLIRA